MCKSPVHIQGDKLMEDRTFEENVVSSRPNCHIKNLTSLSQTWRKDSLSVSASGNSNSKYWSEFVFGSKSKIDWTAFEVSELIAKAQPKRIFKKSLLDSSEIFLQDFVLFKALI